MHCPHDCAHGSAAPSLHQTLEELDFSRGLLGAASDGDYKKVESLLQKGDNPDQVDAYGYSALIYACRHGHSEIVEVLLSHGAKPNVQTNGGATALHRACYHGHLKCVRLLLNKGADCALVDSDGKTALHKDFFQFSNGNTADALQQFSALCFWTQMFEKEKQMELHLAHSNKSGCEIHKAAENGHEEVCRLLLQKSPGLLVVKDNRDRTALDCALPKHSHLSEVLR